MVLGKGRGKGKTGVDLIRWAFGVGLGENQKGGLVFLER